MDKAEDNPRRKPNDEKEASPEEGTVLFKKASYVPSEGSKLEISSEHDLKDKRLSVSSHGGSFTARRSLTRKSGLSGLPSRSHSSGRLRSLDADEAILLIEEDKLERRKSARLIKSKPKMSLVMLKDNLLTAEVMSKINEQKIDYEFELLQEVMQHENKPSVSAGQPKSWEQFMSNMDTSLAKAKQDKKKVTIPPEVMKDLKAVHVGDTKRRMHFLGVVAAAYHMKKLTSAYGSKGKSGKQYFLEAYDTEERPDLTGDEDPIIKFHKYDSRGREIESHVKKAEAVQEVNKAESPFGSPIAIRSLEGVPEENNVHPVESDGTEAEQNFWKFLDDISFTDRDDIQSLTDQFEPCPSISSSATPEQMLQKETDSAGEGGSESNTVSSDPFDPPLDKYLEPTIQEVIQSEYVRKAYRRVHHHLNLFDAKDPLVLDLLGKLYQDVRDFTKLPEDDVAEFEAGNWDPLLIKEDKIFQMEPSEKLLSRFCIYQKALISMAEHFETLRPLLAEINQAYVDVLEKCEKEWKAMDKEILAKLNMTEEVGAWIRQTDMDGDKALMDIKFLSHALQEHVQWQQHTLFSLMGMLWKMRQSLKMQTRHVKKTKVVYKSKVETLAREIVSQQGQSMYESALPGKYTEIMNRFKQIKDPKEVRRILQSGRRLLRKAHKQIVIFEADYADTVPRAEFEMYKAKYTTLHDKNKSVIKRCDELKAEIESMKQNIAKINFDMYDEVGLDMETGEKPIVYLEPLGIGPKVPVYLRYGQRVVDLKYSSQEALALIKDIWKLRVDLLNLCRRVKKAHDNEQEGVSRYPDDLQYDMPEIKPFPDFVAEYFKNKCDLEESSMEFSYNLVAACRRNEDDFELSQFLGILEGSVNEAVYHLFQLDLARLSEIVITKADESKEDRGYLSFGEFFKLLQETFPRKTEDELKELAAVAKDVTGARIDISMVPAPKFFEKSESSGTDNDFVKLLHAQFEQARKFYAREIYVELLFELGISEKLLEHADDPAWLTDISMHVFYAAVTSIDPEITNEGLACYLSWVYLGITALPGITTLGTRLVEFLKEHMGDYEEKYDEDLDLEFEDCIRQLKEYDEDDSNMDKLDMKKRRLQTKKLKYASLRQVTDRLNTGPFVRFGKRPVHAMNMNSEYSQIPSETVVEEAPAEAKPPRRHRRHRDRSGEDEEEQEDRRRRHRRHHRSNKSRKSVTDSVAAED